MFFSMQFRCHPELVKTRNLATDQIFAQVNIKIQHAMSLHPSLFERLWNVFQDGFLRCQLSLRPLDGHQDDTELVRQFWIRVSSFQACVVVSKHGYAVKTTSFKSCGDWCHPSAKIKVSPLSSGVWAVCQCGFSWVMKLERLAAWMFDSTCGFYRSSKCFMVTGKSKMHKAWKGTPLQQTFAMPDMENSETIPITLWAVHNGCIRTNTKLHLQFSLVWCHCSMPCCPVPTL